MLLRTRTPVGRPRLDPAAHLVLPALFGLARVRASAPLGLGRCCCAATCPISRAASLAQATAPLSYARSPATMRTWDQTRLLPLHDSIDRSRRDFLLPSHTHRTPPMLPIAKHAMISDRFGTAPCLHSRWSSSLSSKSTYTASSNLLMISLVRINPRHSVYLLRTKLSHKHDTEIC